MNLVQLFTAGGSLVGTAGGLLVLFDRLARLRPVSFVVVTGNRHNAHRYIRVKNVGAVDILVTDVIARPPAFDISTGHSVSEIALALVDLPAVSILEPGQHRDFVIINNPKRMDIQGYTGRIRFAVHWRKASCTWLRQMPVFVRTSTVDLEKMEKALD